MQKAGQATPESPTIPDQETRLLRAKLILEEALETIEGLGVRVEAKAADTDQSLDLAESKLTFSVKGEPDLEAVVDGCADISVVTIDTLVAFGVDDEPVLEEVDRANLRKFGEGSYRREDGKWMKPPGWTPPDILGVIARMGNKG